MWIHLVAILGLGAACGLWIAFQRWVRRRSPGQRGVEDGCGTCGSSCEVKRGIR